MTEQTPDLLALREGLPKKPWTVIENEDGFWDVMAGGDFIAEDLMTEALARAIAAIPSMLERIEKLEADLAESDADEGRQAAEVLRLRALNAEMREALKAAHEVLVTLVKPDPKPAAIHVFAQAVEAEAKARAILAKTESP